MPNKKPALILPIHDPRRQFNAVLEEKFHYLEKNFSDIFVSFSPLTWKDNPEIVEFFITRGIHIYKNKKNTEFGDHFRQGFKLFVDYHRAGNDWAHIACIDRLLFALSSTWHRHNLLRDIKKRPSEDILVFSRSNRAWRTHPDHYCAIEKSADSLASVFLGKHLDLSWCSATLKLPLMEKIVDSVHAKDFSFLAECVFYAYFNGYKVGNHRVDWLEWEDPFWDKINHRAILENQKISRGVNRLVKDEKKIFRLKYNQSITNSLVSYVEKHHQ